jgi:hypothetical protein
MKQRFFDFEVFPNWWCCVFGDKPDTKIDENIKDTFVIVSSDDTNARDKLMSMIKEDDVCVIGYNIKHYDLIIVNAIYQGLRPQEVKIVNDLIINPESCWLSKDHMRLRAFVKPYKACVYQDLMDDSDGSLKEKEAILGLNVLESSVDFNKEDLSDEDKQDVLYYCKQDVFAAMIYFNECVHAYTNQKLAVCKRFNIPESLGRTYTNAKLVAKALNATRMHFADEDKITFTLSNKIEEYCRNNVPYEILNHLLTSQDSFTTRLFNNKVTYGNGGIHSEYSPHGEENSIPIYVESTDEYVLMNIDAASYYPSLMIQQNCLSRAISNKQGFVDIFNERVSIKHKANQTPEDYEIQMADKLILNTTFGASGNKYLDLYDPYMCTITCRLGQILLTALANRIYYRIPGIKIIQSNTDGILIYIRRTDIDKLKDYGKEWSDLTGIVLEYDEMSKIWQANVNNYLMLDDKNHIKSRGAWLQHNFTRGGSPKVNPLTGFCISKAVIKFLTEGADIVESILQNNNLYDFCITAKKGVYSGIVQKNPDGDVELNKCNRFVATTDQSKGQLYKYKRVRKTDRNKTGISWTIVANCPSHVLLLNEDISTYNFDDIKKNIDYMYYVTRAIDKLFEKTYCIVNDSEEWSDRFYYM